MLKNLGRMAFPLSLISLLVFTACENEKAALEAEAQLAKIGVNVTVDPEVPVSSMELLVRDLIAMSGNQSAIVRGDLRAQRLFTPNKGDSPISYLNTRLKAFMPAVDDAELSSRCTFPKELKYTAFFGGGEEPAQEPSRPAEAPESSAKAEMGAANIGTAVWLLSAVNEAEVSCRVGKKLFPIQGSRAGLMMFGPGYKEAEKIIGPLKLKLPTELRQSILVHEARHSDCPTGLTPSDIEVARASRNGKEFDENYRNRRCGHLHTRCPKGHALAGLAACDDFVYGAYYFGAVYTAAAMTYHRNSPEDAKRIIKHSSLLSASAADSFGRLLVDAEAGPLDLSSKDSVQR
ncbi:MAG: hypothetical protein NDJ89_05840 [Oligoflexia bacterium]|nr:hypothetical protein [Oligoflexia bacterium]